MTIVILTFFSALDVLAGATMVFGQNYSLLYGLIKYLAYVYLIKGILSILSSFSVGYYLDWMGTIDLIAGIVLILISFGSSWGIFSKIGIIVIVKGLYSLILSLGK